MPENPILFGMPLAATDDLGRVCPVSRPRKDRQVGLFYFLWMGYHGSQHVYDNTKILEKDPLACTTRARWEAAGGCNSYGSMHWWGEPLHHYYSAADKWVIRKHIRMFMDAGVDFLMIDATNTEYYPAATFALFDVLNEFYQDGWAVPKVGYYTHTQTGKTMQKIYNEFYMAHPEYEHLWYYREGKPFIVGDMTDPDISDEVRAFFTLEDSYMDPGPFRHYSKSDTFTFQLDPDRNMFPWIDFSAEPTLMVDADGQPKMMTISVAEICETGLSIYSHLWNTGDHTRSWDGTQNRNWLPGEEDAWKYGHNFGRQAEIALKADPPLVFICGWNEWLAGNWEPTRYFKPDNALSKYTKDPGDMCMFVDQFNINNSRDLEPMEGGYGDLYFMQMVDFIRRYKGTHDLPAAGQKRTIDMNGCFCQWQDVSAVYRHPVCSNAERDLSVYEGWTGDTPAARKYLPADQIIREAKVCRDDENYYFYVRTVEPMAHLDEDNRMTLFIKSGLENPNWYGYDFAIRRKSAPGSTAALEKSLGGYIWETAGTVQQVISGNEMMISIPASILGLDRQQPEHLEFKWADHWQETGDIWTFYKDGETAPYGRFNYVFPNR